MKKILTTILKYVIGFGIGGFLLWWSLKGLSAQDRADIQAALQRARFWLIIPVFAILLLSHYIRALRWKQILVPMGYNPPILHLLYSILIGYIGNQLIPRAGEILRCSVIARKDKVPMEKLVGTIIAERVTDLLSLAALCVFIFFAEYNKIQEYIDEIAQKSGNKWFAAVVVLLAVIILFFLVKTFRKTKWGAAISKILSGMWEGLVSIKKVKNKLLFFVYTILIWCCYIMSTWIGCFALSETSSLSITTATTLLIFGTFGIIIAPGGLGAYPWAIQKTLIFYNVNEIIGLALGWILWVAQFIFTIIFGTLAYIALTLSKKNQNEERRTHTS
ncbi:lysylphosphatidylglycerol synthase transmembrane domain-containing protein [Foetidibacter luteolus]|uniref:lysylphosphatidylglycerol synthase transmembrane domain-containing protein n=1 Tax=Foetidibacter luteolus TaxID=2608880 RepID=UPI00129AF726|nr:lysylphosphatidylglycerol synthase transmembrane domain-containing protein [Foetidibacter luteolus]